MSARQSGTALVQLGVPRELLESSVRAYLDEIDRRRPEPPHPREGEYAITGRIVELDGARFVPLILTVPGLGWITGIVSVVGAVVSVGLPAMLMFEGWSTGGVLALMLGLLLVTFGVVVAIDRRSRRGRPTGVLCLADRMIVCHPKTVSVFPRDAVIGIVERMYELPGNEHQGPNTNYLGVIVYRDVHGSMAELPLIEAMGRGEAGLTVEANHPEGRYVGTVVRYLVREWLGTETKPSDEPGGARPKRQRTGPRRDAGKRSRPRAPRRD